MVDKPKAFPLSDVRVTAPDADGRDVSWNLAPACGADVVVPAHPKCPKCRGVLASEVEQEHGGDFTILARCDACGWQSPVGAVPWTGEGVGDECRRVLEECSHLAYFDPRERMPTAAENVALAAKYGTDARWMVQVRLGSGRLAWMDGETAALVVPSHVKPRAYYAHINGRPVAWPEVG